MTRSPAGTVYRTNSTRAPPAVLACRTLTAPEGIRYATPEMVPAADGFVVRCPDCLLGTSSGVRQPGQETPDGGRQGRARVSAFAYASTRLPTMRSPAIRRRVVRPTAALHALRGPAGQLAARRTLRPRHAALLARRRRAPRHGD